MLLSPFNVVEYHQQRTIKRSDVKHYYRVHPNTALRPNPHPYPSLLHVHALGRGVPIVILLRGRGKGGGLTTHWK